MVYEQQLRGNTVEFLLVTIYFPKTLQPREWFSAYLSTEHCDDVIQVHVKLDQLVETGTPISDKTYVPLHPGQSSMSVDVVTSFPNSCIYQIHHQT
jgi:hypothetical protein